MPILELSMVTGAIVEMGVQATWEKAKRREAVIKLLKRFNLDPGDPPADFDGIYAYTLVEYGVFKPEPVLNFFRNEFVHEAFRQSFYKNDPSILDKEAEGIIQWNEETGKLGRIDYDPRREFAAFSAVFNEIVDRARTPAEVRRDQKLDRLYGDLHQKTGEILKRLEGLQALADLRAELARLADSYQARQFVFAPSGYKLKVFISSKMLELRDVREVLVTALDKRGIEAWVYEAHAGARPGGVLETSLQEVEAADIYVGLFWQKYGQVTAEEYRHARALGKPCFVYIREKSVQREPELADFLRAEVYDLGRGVSYEYFDSALKLGEQVAEDIMAWLVRRHREMTAEIREARVSQDEITHLQAEVDRLQAASRERLPHGGSVDYLAQQMRAWFETLGYGLEKHEVRNGDCFEWIINVPARRGYDRIVVRGVEGEVELSHVAALRQAVDEHKADEGWLVAVRRISQAARAEADKRENRDLFCYTFDELLDEDANFDGYFAWLEGEVKRRDIDRMYVPLACTKEEYDPNTKQEVGTSRYDERNGWIDGYIDRWLDDPSKEHISILGEFGTGKTWFALHFAWVALQRYREAKGRGIERPHLPLVIPLRDYAKAVSVESLFSEFFFRKHEIPLPGYSAFEQLNRMGKLLLIFDGFDEMAAKVDRQQMINNFWELARVVVPGSKAILTCRTEHFPEAQEGRSLLGAELQASTSKLTGEPPQFEVLELEKFNDDQVRQVLSFRAGPGTVEQVMSDPQLVDLVRRPVMTELIVDALPDIEAGKPVDLSRIYLYAVWRKMEQDIKAERTFTSMADKLYFLCELSWEMLSTGRMSLNYRDFPDRIRRLFGPAVQEQKDLDHWHYDMMGQTMLVRNTDGDYAPAHRSLLEFFLGYKFAAELGILAPDFVELARAQGHVDESRSPQGFTWSEYFQRDVDETGKTIIIPPLKKFVSESLTNLQITLGQAPITKAIFDLLMPMVDTTGANTKQTLIGVLKATRGRTGNEVGYVGGNAATILVRVDSAGLKDEDLTGTVIMGADLTNATLCNLSLREANLCETTFQNTDLTGCDLQRADLKHAQFRGAALKNADLQGADLTNVQFNEMGNVRSVAFNPHGNWLAAATSSGIKIWETNSGTLVFDDTGPHRSYLRDVQFSPRGDTFAAASRDGTISVWDTSSFSILRKLYPGEGKVHRIAYSPDSLHIAAGSAGNTVAVFDIRDGSIKRMGQPHKADVTSLAYRPDGTYLLSGSYDSTVVGWLLKTSERDFVIAEDFGSSVNGIVFSPDGESFVVASHSSSIRVYPFRMLQPSCMLHTQTSVWSVAYSSDGGLIAGTDWDRIVLWNAKTYSKLLEIEQAHEDRIRRLAFSPDNLLLASGSTDSTVRLWDARPFIARDGEPHINVLEYNPPDLSSISDSSDTWPEWWQRCKINVPKGMVPNPDFGKCLRVIEQEMNCEGLKLAGAKGLDAMAPSGFGTLGEWLAERGAILE